MSSVHIYAIVFTIEIAPFLWQWLFTQILLWIGRALQGYTRALEKVTRFHYDFKRSAAFVTVLAPLLALYGLVGEPLALFACHQTTIPGLQKAICPWYKPVSESRILSIFVNFLLSLPKNVVDHGLNLQITVALVGDSVSPTTTLLDYLIGALKKVLSIPQDTWREYMGMFLTCAFVGNLIFLIVMLTWLMAMLSTRSLAPYLRNICAMIHGSLAPKKSLKILKDLCRLFSWELSGLLRFSANAIRWVRLCSAKSISHLHSLYSRGSVICRSIEDHLATFSRHSCDAMIIYVTMPLPATILWSFATFAETENIPSGAVTPTGGPWLQLHGMICLGEILGRTILEILCELIIFTIAKIGSSIAALFKFTIAKIGSNIAALFKYILSELIAGNEAAPLKQYVFEERGTLLSEKSNVQIEPIISTETQIPLQTKLVQTDEEVISEPEVAVFNMNARPSVRSQQPVMPYEPRVVEAPIQTTPVRWERIENENHNDAFTLFKLRYPHRRTWRSVHFEEPEELAVADPPTETVDGIGFSVTTEPNSLHDHVKIQEPSPSEIHEIQEPIQVQETEANETQDQVHYEPPVDHAPLSFEQQTPADIALSVPVMDLPVELPMELPIEFPVEQPMESPPGQPWEILTEQPVETFTERPLDIFTEPLVHDFAEQSTQVPTEPLMRDFTEQSTQATIEQSSVIISKEPKELPMWEQCENLKRRFQEQDRPFSVIEPTNLWEPDEMELVHEPSTLIRNSKDESTMMEVNAEIVDNFLDNDNLQQNTIDMEVDQGALDVEESTETAMDGLELSPVQGDVDMDAEEHSSFAQEVLSKVPEQEVMMENFQANNDDVNSEGLSTPPGSPIQSGWGPQINTNQDAFLDRLAQNINFINQEAADEELYRIACEDQSGQGSSSGQQRFPARNSRDIYERRRIVEEDRLEETAEEDISRPAQFEVLIRRTILATRRQGARNHPNSTYAPSTPESLQPGALNQPPFSLNLGFQSSANQVHAQSHAQTSSPSPFVPTQPSLPATPSPTHRSSPDRAPRQLFQSQTTSEPTPCSLMMNEARGSTAPTPVRAPGSYPSPHAQAPRPQHISTSTYQPLSQFQPQPLNPPPTQGWQPVWDTSSVYYDRNGNEYEVDVDDEGESPEHCFYTDEGQKIYFDRQNFPIDSITGRPWRG